MDSSNLAVPHDPKRDRREEWIRDAARSFFVAGNSAGDAVECAAYIWDEAHASVPGETRERIPLGGAAVVKAARATLLECNAVGQFKKLPDGEFGFACCMNCAARRVCLQTRSIITSGEQEACESGL